MILYIHMFECPYCHHIFTTKQRLISHLTRNIKCYDVTAVGVPAMLLELIGAGGTKPASQATTSTSTTEEVTSGVEEGVVLNGALVCTNCMKQFATQKNLDKHQTTVKCHKKKAPEPDIYLSKKEQATFRGKKTSARSDS